MPWQGTLPPLRPPMVGTFHIHSYSLPPNLVDLVLGNVYPDYMSLYPLDLLTVILFS
jgi:hypothetical protein